MKLAQHCLSAIPLAAAGYAASGGSWAGAFAAGFSSVLIDLDHVTDYVLYNRGWGGVRDFFKLVQYHVSALRDATHDLPMEEASVMVEVEGAVEHTAATGNGPVNALDTALRKALLPFYPRLKEMKLLDFKVRVLSADDGSGGTGSVVRVLIESGDANSTWVTVGVSHDIIEASWQALADSITYKLYKDEYEHRQKQG